MLDKHRNSLNELKNRPKTNWKIQNTENFNPELGLKSNSNLLTIIESVENGHNSTKSKKPLIKKSIKLREDILESITELIEGRGLGTRISFLFNRYQKNLSIYSKQAGPLRALVDQFNKNLDMCLANKQDQSELKILASKINTINNLLSWDEWVKEKVLSPKEIATVNVALRLHRS